ncbi:MAG: hypothetical protein E5X97_27355 [Mesorhizobium sp.]|nr:MAG: hypothetical protein E5X97_27355 [Mesorhizobium sp.]
MEAANDNSELPRSRAEAKAIGAKHYFTAKPCKHGHVDIRLTSSGQCRECARISQRAAYPSRAEKLRAYQVEYRANNRQWSREMSRKWRSENPERFVAGINAWKAANPDYRQRNLERFREKDRQYSAKRRSTPRGRVDDAISAGIRDTLKRGGKRGTKWEVLVGYMPIRFSPTNTRS